MLPGAVQYPGLVQPFTSAVSGGGGGPPPGGGGGGGGGNGNPGGGGGGNNGGGNGGGPGSGGGGNNGGGPGGGGGGGGGGKFRSKFMADVAVMSAIIASGQTQNTMFLFPGGGFAAGPQDWQPEVPQYTPQRRPYVDPVSYTWTVTGGRAGALKLGAEINPSVILKEGAS